MDIGTGIAIAGAWLFPSACVCNKNMTGLGMLFASLCAIGVTIAVLW